MQTELVDDLFGEGFISFTAERQKVISQASRRKESLKDLLILESKKDEGVAYEQNVRTLQSLRRPIQIVINGKLLNLSIYIPEVPIGRWRLLNVHQQRTKTRCH